jgi:hypothetical protein
MGTYSMLDFCTTNLEYLENLILFLSKPNAKNCLRYKAVKGNYFFKFEFLRPDLAANVSRAPSVSFFSASAARGVGRLLRSYLADAGV